MGTGLWICKVPIDQIREQDINARVMKSDLQDRLSGHHRYRSARAAGMKELVCLVDITGLSRSKIASKQLAHNAIEGIDDEDTLKEICKMIDNVDDMIASAVDQNLFKNMEEDLERIATPATNFDFKQIAFTFLPHQQKALDHLTENALTADWMGIANIDQFEDFVDALKRVQKFQNVKSIGTAIHIMVETALRDLGENGYGDLDTDWEPLSKIFGGGVIPKSSADVIKRAVEKGIKNGDCDKKTKWSLIQKMCEVYLDMPGGKGDM